MPDQGTELCKYSPDRGVDYYASGLAGILNRVVGSGQTSTHAYVKEVRRAMETLVFSVWEKAEEYIPVLAEANIPEIIYSMKGRECYKELLTGLLRRFRETTEDIPIGARIRLMNIVISSIAEMARYNVPPVGELVQSQVFSKPGQTQAEGDNL